MPFNVNEIDLGILVENMPDLIFYLIWTRSCCHSMQKKTVFKNDRLS